MTPIIIIQVNLDDPAPTRWDHVVKPRAQGIEKLISTFMHNAPLNKTIVKVCACAWFVCMFVCACLMCDCALSNI